VREAAAHHPGVRLDGNRLQPAAHKEFRVGLLHREVAADGGLVVDIERIRILHHKLPRAHQAVSRADFIPEFRGDLVEVLREVAVAGDLRLHERRDDLLVRRAEHELRFARGAMPVARVVGAVHDLARRSPARPGLPELDRMQVRHPQLNRARRIHLSRHSCVIFCNERRPRGRYV